MNELDGQQEQACPAKCPQCSASRAEDGVCRPGGLTGWRFAVVAVVAFAVPMVLCAAAAIVAGTLGADKLGKEGQLLAALAALIAGVVIAGLIVRRIAPTQAREAR